MDEVLTDAPDVGRAALVTQRSTVVAWDRQSGSALAPVLSWQDTRAWEGLAGLDLDETALRERTGLWVSPHYGASKLAWLLAHEEAVARAHAQGRLVLGPLVSFVLFHLLEERPVLVDHANAQRTLLWNLHSLDWDETLLKTFGIARDDLPHCCPIRHPYGRLKGRGLPLVAVSGDQTAGLFAEGPPRSDTAYVNIGTGAFVLMPTGSTPVLHAPLLSGIALSDGSDALYYLEGTVNGAGAALGWIERHLGISVDFERLDAGIETHAPPLFLNGVSGLGSPWWSQAPAPRFIGMDGIKCRDEPAPCIAAVLESIVFMLNANLALIRRHAPLKRLKLGGGLSRARDLCQKLADLSGLPVRRSEQIETTGRGAAWLAGGTPMMRTDTDTVFQPRENPALEARYHRYLELLEREVAA